MHRIILIIILLIFSLNIAGAKKATVIYIETKSDICVDLLILGDDNNDDRYDESIYYISCRGAINRSYSVIDNFGVSSILQYYIAHLISGSYEGPDFTYVLKETLTDKAVAKLYYNNVLKKLIIDPLRDSCDYNNNYFDKLDEYFYYFNQNGIITLTKKSDFEVNKIFISDLYGKTIYLSDKNQFSYTIEALNGSCGEYFLSVITPKNYLMKKIILLK